MFSVICSKSVILELTIDSGEALEFSNKLNIEAIRSHGKVWKYKGEAFVEGKKMADAQWSATIVDRK